MSKVGEKPLSVILTHFCVTSWQRRVNWDMKRARRVRQNSTVSSCPVCRFGFANEIKQCHKLVSFFWYKITGTLCQLFKGYICQSFLWSSKAWPFFLKSISLIVRPGKELTHTSIFFINDYSSQQTKEVTTLKCGIKTIRRYLQGQCLSVANASSELISSVNILLSVPFWEINTMLISPTLVSCHLNGPFLQSSRSFSLLVRNDLPSVEEHKIFNL